MIADAKRPGVLADAVAGVAGVGTLVRASAQRLPARKLWIGFAVVSQGEVAVDPGARAAPERGKSLLAIGVRSVSGAFDAGAACAGGLGRVGIVGGHAGGGCRPFSCRCG